MANIDQYIEQIRVAEYGEEVRGSIINALQAENAESSGAYTAAITAQNSASNSASSAAASAATASNAVKDATDAGTKAVNDIQTTAAASLAQMAGYDSSTAANATAAANSATSAANSASSAQGSATAAQGYLATVQANAAAAKQSETNAKASETSAATSASNASKSATDAQSARTQAMQAATNAQTSATTANSSQTAAANSATNAAQSEQAAYNYAQQAKAIAGISTATTTTPGIVMPDGKSITIDSFGRISVTGLNEHIADSLVSQNGVHGVRIYPDPTTKFIAVQQWNEDEQVWNNLINGLKADGETIIMDDDGTLHGANNLPLTVKEGKLCIKYLKDV